LNEGWGKRTRGKARPHRNGPKKTVGKKEGKKKETRGRDQCAGHEKSRGKVGKRKSGGGGWFMCPPLVQTGQTGPLRARGGKRHSGRGKTRRKRNADHFTC